jgi:uncharacterized RmlC-like cupin family protein
LAVGWCTDHPPQGVRFQCRPDAWFAPPRGGDDSERGSDEALGPFTVDAKAKTGPHHHGDLETVIYVLNGIARLRWGERLEFEAEASAGDFIYVPPYVPHQEINPSPDLQLQCVLARSGQKGLVFNLEIEGVETPELVRWIDDLHK